jgi:hypothetical protein
VLRFLVVAFPFVAVGLIFACSDTPRGVQGILYYDEAGIVGDDAGDTAVPDVQGPCHEIADPSGYCEQLGGSGTLYTHLIVCTTGAQPLLIDCESNDASADGGALDAGGSTDGGSLGVTDFCCTTGLF